VVYCHLSRSFSSFRKTLLHPTFFLHTFDLSFLHPMCSSSRDFKVRTPSWLAAKVSPLYKFKGSPPTSIIPPSFPLFDTGTEVLTLWVPTLHLGLATKGTCSHLSPLPFFFYNSWKPDLTGITCRVCLTLSETGGERFLWVSPRILPSDLVYFFSPLFFAW